MRHVFCRVCLISSCRYVHCRKDCTYALGQDHHSETKLYVLRTVYSVFLYAFSFRQWIGETAKIIDFRASGKYQVHARGIAFDGLAAIEAYRRQSLTSWRAALGSDVLFSMVYCHSNTSCTSTRKSGVCFVYFHRHFHRHFVMSHWSGRNRKGGIKYI